MHIFVMVVAALAVLSAALIGEVGLFGAQPASTTVSQLATPSPQVLETVNEAKSKIEDIKAQTPIKDLSAQDPTEACRDRARELAKERGRTKFAWASSIKASKTKKIKTQRGNPAFLVNVKADGERTFCAVIFESSSCKVDMFTCTDEPEQLQVSRFGKLASK